MCVRMKLGGAVHAAASYLRHRVSLSLCCAGSAAYCPSQLHCFGTATKIRCQSMSMFVIPSCISGQRASTHPSVPTAAMQHKQLSGDTAADGKHPRQDSTLQSHRIHSTGFTTRQLASPGLHVRIEATRITHQTPECFRSGRLRQCCVLLAVRGVHHSH